MKLLNTEQAKSWCQDRGIHAEIASGLVSLRYSVPHHQCLQAVLTDGAPQIVAMGHALLLQDLAEPDAQDFAGALIWLRDWDIWNEAFERSGSRMLELLRRQLTGGDPPATRDAPAHLFSPREFVDAHVLLTIPLVFQWDAYVVPASGRCLALVSHEGYVRIAARTDAILSRITERFKLANWNPEECPPG